MDNLTHSLVGLTAAKAGLEKVSPGATTLCLLAANAPDVDVAILLFGDRWTYLHHHRGITHALVGVAFLAVLLPLIVYGADRLWARLKQLASQEGKTMSELLDGAIRQLLRDRSSRPADPVSSSTFEPAGIVVPCSSTSAVVQRPCTGDGAS